MTEHIFHAKYRNVTNGNSTEEKIKVTAGNLNSAWRFATLRATQAPMSEKSWELVGMSYDYPSGGE